MWTPILSDTWLPIGPEDPVARFRRTLANHEFAWTQAKEEARLNSEDPGRMAASATTLARGAPAAGWGSRIVGGISYV